MADVKPTHTQRKLYRYIHLKYQGIQRKFQEFQRQYEHSGTTSSLFAQSECQGAMTAYQDLLHLYDMHRRYDHKLPSQNESGQPFDMLTEFREFCQHNYQDAQYRMSQCQHRYAASGNNKYLFLQRQYAGEVMAYQSVSQYIDTLEPGSGAGKASGTLLADSRPQNVKRPTAGQSPGLLHIVVIENSALIRRSIEMILQAEGFSVTTASDGVIGFDIARKVSPDLILMDSAIARHSEEQLIFLLRRQKELRNIPIILLEGTGHQLDERIRRQLGIKTGIQKPFQPDELLQTIQATLAQ